MNLFRRLNAFVLAATVAGSGALVGALAAPASADQCGSNRNIAHVNMRLDGAIDQMSHDARDYGGHRVAAINDLTQARQELSAAQRFAIDNNHENPACFDATGAAGGSDFPWGVRKQRGSDKNVAGVQWWIGDLLKQLSGDNHNYGGHKAAAMKSIQAAQNELFAADHYAEHHGY